MNSFSHGFWWTLGRNLADAFWHPGLYIFLGLVFVVLVGSLARMRKNRKK